MNHIPLSDKQCQAKAHRSLEKRSDGFGLQLWVKPSGSRLWRLAYRFNGKQKLLSLGSYPTVSLAKARERRERARELLADGVDPSEARKTERAEANSVDNTFHAIAESYVAKLTREGRRASTIKKLKWLLGFAYPKLGHLNIRVIRAPDILPVLQAVEVRGTLETARRLRETIGCVFRLAMAQGKVEADPTVALRRALARPQHVPRAAITDPKAFGGLLRAIDGFEGQPCDVE